MDRTRDGSVVRRSDGSGNKNFRSRNTQAEQPKRGNPTLHLRLSHPKNRQNDRWDEGEVSSSMEKPFDTLEPWDEIIRYNGSAGIMLQLAIPSDSLDRFWTSHGHEDAVRRKFGATLEVGQAIKKAEGDGSLVQSKSLLLSGTRSEVDTVRRLLRKLRPSTKDSRSGIDPVKPLSRDCGESAGPAGSLAGLSLDEPTMDFDTKGSPKRLDDRPLSALKLWECVVRRGGSAERFWNLQFVAPAEEWNEITLRPGFAGWDVLRPSPELPVFDYSEAGPEISGLPTLVVTLKGKIGNVQKLLKTFRQARGSRREFREAHIMHIPRLGPNVPYGELASHDLHDWECVIRNRTASGVLTVEAMIPTNRWHSMMVRDVSIIDAAERSNVVLSSETLPGKSDRLLITMHGTIDALQKIGEVVMSSASLNKGRRGRTDQPQPPNGKMQDETTMISPTNSSSLGAFELIASPAARPEEIENQSAAQGLLEHQKPGQQHSEPTHEVVQLLDDVKTALRPLTHPVVLITSKAPNTAKSQGNLSSYRGMTVSSFSSVTLTRTPIVSFNIKLPSRTWDAIQASERFCVHLLAGTPSGASIANIFTQPYEHPASPFESLMKGSVGFLQSSPVRSRRPPLIVGPGVHCHLMARLLRDKCVEVGDHVIVVGQIDKVKSGVSDSVTREGLAYAMKGYRGTGAIIEPRELAADDTKTAADADAPPAVMIGQQAKLVARNDHEATDGTMQSHVVSAMQSKDTLDAGETTAESNMSNHHEIHENSRELAAHDQRIEPPINQSPAIELKDQALGEVELPAAGFHGAAASSIDTQWDTETFMEEMSRSPDEGEEARVPESSLDQKQTKDSSQPPREELRNQQVESTERTRAKDATTRRQNATAAAPGSRTPEITPVHNTGPSAPVARGPSYAWGLKPTLTSSFSSLADRTRRAYSSATAGAMFTDPRTQITHTSLLSMTVADFFGETGDVFVRKPRMRDMMKSQKAAHTASRQLERALSDGTLTPEESTRLETIVTRSERHIARKLANSSATDLKDMLDTGRIIDQRRTQWLESSIEKGLAVLLQEAKRLREAYDQKLITEEAFRSVKKTLEEEHMLLDTEVMRLRQMVDEEGEDGGMMGPEEAQGGEGGRFDGFRGNV